VSDDDDFMSAVADLLSTPLHPAPLAVDMAFVELANHAVSTSAILRSTSRQLTPPQGNFDAASHFDRTTYEATFPPRDSRIVQPARTRCFGVGGPSNPQLATKMPFDSADHVVAVSMTAPHPVSLELTPQPGSPGDFDMTAGQGFTQHPTTFPPRDSRIVESTRTWFSGVGGLSAPPLAAKMPFDSTGHDVATSMATPHPISSELTSQPALLAVLQAALT